MTAFHRLIQAGAADKTELVLIDIGPTPGAINRSALVASDQVCIPPCPGPLFPSGSPESRPNPARVAGNLGGPIG